MTTPAEEVAVEPADLVAEIDDEPEPDVIDAEPEDDPDACFTGVCHGGPWDGRTVCARYPKGFLLVDMPARQLWIYDREGDAFQARSDEPETLNDEGERNRWRAAEEPNYDILVPDAEMDIPQPAGGTT